jgi:hypothetical protein
LRTSLAVVLTLCAVISVAAGRAHGQGISQPAPERFVVSGVIVLEDGAGMAWLREPALTGDQVVALRPGDSVGPYRLTKILADRIELEGPAGKILLPIYDGLRAPLTSVASANPGTSRSIPSPGPSSATAPGPTAASSVDSEIPTALREHMEVVRQQAQQQANQRVQQQMQQLQQQLQPQIQQPAQQQGQRQQGQQQAEVAQTGTENPFANNPNVNFIPLGDPRRRQGLQSFFGGGH